MSQNSILANNSIINNFIKELRLPLYYSKAVITHIVEFIIGITQKGCSGTITDIVDCSVSSCHRTTFGHFLSKGVWKEEVIQKKIAQIALQRFRVNCRNTNLPAFVIYDDTVCNKTKPSSQAMNPIEEAFFIFSHLDRKCVWGHQILQSMIQCGDECLPFEFRRYTKKEKNDGEKTKIEHVCELAEKLPVLNNKSYALVDSWFTCDKVINAHKSNGYELIGAMKTNRVIYPKDYPNGIQISEFAKTIEIADVRLVTVNNAYYFVYRYEGSLNGVDQAVVLLSWTEDSCLNPQAVRAFLCTDTSLDTKTILEYYSKRWPIEIFFRDEKNKLNINKYQVRSIKAIERFWILVQLSYLYCLIGISNVKTFSEGLNKVRNQTKKDYVTLIYKYSQEGMPLVEILKLLKITADKS